MFYRRYGPSNEEMDKYNFEFVKMVITDVICILILFGGIVFRNYMLENPWDFERSSIELFTMILVVFGIGVAIGAIFTPFAYRDLAKKKSNLRATYLELYEDGIKGVYLKNDNRTLVPFVLTYDKIYGAKVLTQTVKSRTNFVIMTKDSSYSILAIENPHEISMLLKNKVDSALAASKSAKQSEPATNTDIHTEQTLYNPTVSSFETPMCSENDNDVNEVPSQKQFCCYCGKPINPEGAFCPFCGMKYD